MTLSITIDPPSGLGSSNALSLGLYSIGIGVGAFAGFVALLLAA